MAIAQEEFREVCARCRRPVRVCYCRHVTPVPTRTRVVLLQHPRERDMAIGTARMASLCLPNSELCVGIDWKGSPELARAMSDPARPAVLLYPGPGAIDVTAHPPAGPVTLIVVDGTWWQARKVVRSNPDLLALPRYAFTPTVPSEYRIRKEPDPAYVSTIEALVHVLSALESDPAPLQALLTPFRAMIDAQIEHARSDHARTRHAKKTKRPAGPRVPRVLVERATDIVCVVGEANAWPYRCRERDVTYEDEIVHWVAHRPSTGETLDFIVAPQHPLAPRATEHVRLSAEALQTGGTLEGLHAAWRSFVKDTDLVCSWGRYATSLWVAGGGSLPRSRIDMRQVARVFTGGKVGTLEDMLAKLGVSPGPDLARGRAGMRLSQIAAVFGALASS